MSLVFEKTPRLDFHRSLSCLVYRGLLSRTAVVIEPEWLLALVSVSSYFQSTTGNTIKAHCSTTELLFRELSASLEMAKSQASFDILIFTLNSPI